MKGQFYKAKRRKLLEKVKDNSVIVLFAGNAPKKTADEAYPFTPNRNFYYLTGVQEPDHILLMSKINGKEKNGISGQALFYAAQGDQTAYRGASGVL